MVIKRGGIKRKITLFKKFLNKANRMADTKKEKKPLAPGTHTIAEGPSYLKGRMYSIVRVLHPSRGIKLAICEYVPIRADVKLLDEIALEIDQQKRGRCGVHGIETKLVPDVLKDKICAVSLMFFDSDEQLVRQVNCMELWDLSCFFIEGNPEERFPGLFKFTKFAEYMREYRSW